MMTPVPYLVFGEHWQAVWLRQAHDLHVNVQHNYHYAWQVQVQDIRCWDGTSRVIDECWLGYDYSSYEQALTAGIQSALDQLNLPSTLSP